MNPPDHDPSAGPPGPPGPPSLDADDNLLLLWAAMGGRADLGPAIAERFAQRRRRLARKIAASAQAARALRTTRYAPPAMVRANARARVQTLYLAAEDLLRPGEPLNVLLIELAPHGGLQLDPPAAGVLREWLLVRGGVRLASAAGLPVTLAPLDYHIGSVSARQPHLGAAPTQLEAGPQGALLFLREARAPADYAAQQAARTVRDAQAPWKPYGPKIERRVLWRHERLAALLFLREARAPADYSAQQAARTVRDAEAPWKPYGPKIERRVLWRHGRLAALLYRAAPGARVPPHGHEHDEECLVLRGETFQDEILLREADYQLAPAGSGHLSGSTDVGAVFYIHGDLDLALQRAPADPG